MGEARAHAHAPTLAYWLPPMSEESPSPASVSGSPLMPAGRDAGADPGGAAAPAARGRATGSPGGADCCRPGGAPASPPVPEGTPEGACSPLPPSLTAAHDACILDRLGPGAPKAPQVPGDCGGPALPGRACEGGREEAVEAVETSDDVGVTARPSPMAISAMPVTKSSNSRAPGLSGPPAGSCLPAAPPPSVGGEEVWARAEEPQHTGARTKRGGRGGRESTKQRGRDVRQQRRHRGATWPDWHDRLEVPRGPSSPPGLPLTELRDRPRKPRGAMVVHACEPMRPQLHSGPLGGRGQWRGPLLQPPAPAGLLCHPPAGVYIGGCERTSGCGMPCCG